MKSSSLLLIIYVLLLSNLITAENQLVFNSTMNMSRGEIWTGELYSSTGSIQVNISSTQGNLNLLISQGNLSKSFNILPSDGQFTTSLIFNPGNFSIFLKMTNNFIISTVNILVFEDTSSSFVKTKGLLITGSVLAGMLLPFVFLYGKSRGRIQS